MTSTQLQSRFTSCGTRIFSRALIYLLPLMLAGLLSAACAYAQTCTVTSTADTNTSGTLRYCLTSPSSGETISITATGTIKLTSTLPAISTNLTITGPGANQLTVSGNNLYQVFNISSGTVSISGLTIANGNNTDGGGIDNAGTLTVTNDIFSGNSASGNGGGIYSSGALTVQDCTFSGNSATNGGGIDVNTGTVTVTNSTFSGNSASSGGGGIDSSTTLNVTNSTFSGNSANGGNGGGIDGVGGTATVNNDIFSGNSASGNGGGIYNGNTVNASYNVFYINTNGDCYGCTTNSDAVDTNPMLAPLANYGGTTGTMLPLPGSSAICAGLVANVPSGVTTDQRGFARLNTTYTTSTCVDAGAVQSNYQSVQFTNVPGDGDYTAANNITPSPAPIVSVTENGQNIGAVPVTLTDASLTVTGLGPVTTVAGTGATFNSVEDSAVEDTTLEASLQITPAAITPPYTFSASASFDTTDPATPAFITSPTPGTQLPGTSVQFIWNPGNTAKNFELFVGTLGIGTSNLYNSGDVGGTSLTVGGLPSNGETVYVRLYWLISGSWQYASYTYTASGSAIPAFITLPAPSSKLGGTSVTFDWNPGNRATYFELFVGTLGIGTSNLYNSGQTGATSATVSDLPSNGETVYVRLYSLIAGAWQYNSYTYTASGSATPATLTTPTPNTTTPLTGTSVTFDWNPGNTATYFELFVGTLGIGTSNLYNSGETGATSATVSDLPSNGSKVYVRLYSLINGAWQYNDYTYVALSTAFITTPAPGSKLGGTSVTFDWNPGSRATNFELFVGTLGIGTSNLYNSGDVGGTSLTVSDLPSNGETVYVRLYSLINGVWLYNSYTYKASGSPIAASLTNPYPPGSTLSGTSVNFTWNPGNVATNFELFVGTLGVGTSNLYNSGQTGATSATVSDLPSNGETVYVRLYSLINGAWQYTDYTYVATGSPTPAVLTTPTPNTSTPLTGTSVTFSWTPGNTAKYFELFVGTLGIGTSNLYNSGQTGATSATVSDLPSNGSKVYVRLYSLINGAWQYTDYTYVATGSPTPAVLTTPTPNTSTPLTGTSVTFSWTPGNTAKNFELFVGTLGIGTSNLYNSGETGATSATVSDLPSNGSTVYVRLYYLINGVWEYTSYTYVAF
jgi:predicted outer membrane repeat protein